MNQIMAKMRTIALAAEPLLPQFANQSHSPGERLMAIAILQLKPRQQWLQWLADRMGKEHPFIFYHAAVALQRAVEHLGAECREELRSAIEKADATMHAFEGVPDVNTVNALTWAAEDLSALEEKK